MTTVSASVITTTIITAIAAGVGARVVANLLKVPSIVFLLILGLGLGESGLGIIQPSYLGAGLETIVSLSVALILFEGGMSLRLRELGKVSGSLRNLVTIGTVITLVGAGLSAHWLAEFPWTIAFLYGALVVVTGPIVINPIVEEAGVDGRLAAVLEGEGVLIDAIGAVLAVVVLDVVLNINNSAFGVVQDLVVRLGTGSAIGVGGGWLMAKILKSTPSLPLDSRSVLVVGGLLCLFGWAQSLQSESGLMTAVLAGIVLRSADLPDQRLLLTFYEQLITLIVSALFVLLAASLSIPSVFALGWGAVLTVLCLMLVVRPLSVWVCTWGSNFNWRQKLFLAWCAPRGIIAASVASLFAILLTERGINGGSAIKALVFLTIAMTVFLQGLTAKTLAQVLGLRENPSQGVVIVGSNPLGILVGRILQENQQRVAIVDTSAEACRQAMNQGLPAYVSNGLDSKALASAGLDSAGTLLTLTVNTDINLVIAQRAVEEFRPYQVFAIYNRQATAQSHARPIIPAFADRVSVKTWNQYLTQREVQIDIMVLQGEWQRLMEKFNFFLRQGAILPLLFERPSQWLNRWQIVPADIQWQEGDRILYLQHIPRFLPQGDLPPLLEPEPNDINSEQDYLAMAKEILSKVR
ncbi:MAG: cation:proton antiporter [Pseudanabaenaceae cyanobacterium]